MALTEEQQERMRTNKERALEIRRRKEEEAEAKQQQQQEGVADTNNTTQIRSSNNTNNIKISTNEPKSVIKIQIKNDKQEPDDNVELEEFQGSYIKFSTIDVSNNTKLRNNVPSPSPSQYSTYSSHRGNFISKV